jgi:hypothetical protein
MSEFFPFNPIKVSARLQQDFKFGYKNILADSVQNKAFCGSGVCGQANKNPDLI